MSVLIQEKLGNQFRLLDADGDGLISRADYLRVAGRLCRGVGLDPDSARGHLLHDRFGELFDLVCGAGAEGLTIQEYVRRTRGRIAEAGANLLPALRPVIADIAAAGNTDDDEELSPVEFRGLFAAWGLTPREADLAFARLDLDASGQLSVDELAEAFAEFYGSEDEFAPGNLLFGELDMHRDPTARIPYPRAEELPEATKALLGQLPPLNIFRMFAHASTTFAPAVGLAMAVLSDLELPNELRELAILQVAQELDATYVWTQHVSAARAESTSRSKIVAVRDGRLDARCLTEVEQASLAFTAEVLHRNRPSEQTLTRLREHLSSRQIVELLVTIGVYTMMGRITTALALDADRSAGDTAVEVARQHQRSA